MSKTNAYNANIVDAMKGYSIRANVKPLHNVVAGIGFGSLKTGTVKTDVINIAAEYEVYQNFVISLIWNEAKTSGNPLAVGDTKITSTTVDIEALM
ncbi:MAG: hypothetical protein R8K50_07935 [Mariprofundus sp.]